MLDRRQRLTDPQEFAATVRRGRRAGTPNLVVHWTEDRSPLRAEDGVPAAPARAGLVVGRSVGNAVVRNRVKRRLRHLVRGRLDGIPAGTLLVVRALPPAASASWELLGRDLDRALERGLGRALGRPPQSRRP